MRTIYKDIISSKTGFKIPILSNGKTIESRYNPEIDVDRKIESIKKDDSFYLIIGLASGLLVSRLLELNKNALFLITENSKEDIEFLKSFPNAKKIIDEANYNTSKSESDGIPQKNRIKICIKDDLEKTLTSLYIPALHGNLNIIEQTNYLSDDLETKAFIKDKIDDALKNIMADFSVQTHFGKIWQRNIMQNLMQYRITSDIYFPTEKTAVILAAGSTLDSFLEKLSDSAQRENYYVIATDTAFSAASKRGITADAVVSIDGQLVSENHFLHPLSRETLFVFDLCANPSAIRKTAKYTNNIIFSESGHPLAKLASTIGKENTENKNHFINLFAGSGTVTITALDFAIKAGFSKIEIAGADFSYINGKPYAKGTYLDSLYNKTSNRISTSETAFSKLMYRTELIKTVENSYTTTVLRSYKNSLEEYLSERKLNFKKEKNIYYISKKLSGSDTFHSEQTFQINDAELFSYPDFYKSILSSYEKLDLSKINQLTYSEHPIESEYYTPHECYIVSGIPPLIMSVLPYIAHLRLSNQKITMQEMVKLALTNLLRYNSNYEK